MPEEKDIIIDAFAGVGGNAIAFAREGRWRQVFAIEKDPATLECAKHNAKIYGVSNKIVWINGDCFDVIEKRFRGAKNAVIFASPPWGGKCLLKSETSSGYVHADHKGTEYGNVDVFDLSKMEPYNLDTLYKCFSRFTRYMALFLPRNSDLNQIAQYAPKDRKMEVAHYCIKGASKVSRASYSFLPTTNVKCRPCVPTSGISNFQQGTRKKETSSKGDWKRAVVSLCYCKSLSGAIS